MFSNDETDEYRQQLLALKEKLEAFDKASSESAKTVDLDEPFGRLSRMDAMQQQKMSQAHQKRNDIRLRQVHAALSRIEEGAYGECMRCGEYIQRPRLQARPEVPICLECQTELEGS